jgi:hypothetical protein
MLANPRWLGAESSGFTMVLHTWNQRLHFHPHLHTIVPGAGIDKTGRVVTVKNANFLVPQPALRAIFRARFRDALPSLTEEHGLPPADPAVWEKDWGVDIRPFGGGENIIKYLGRSPHAVACPCCGAPMRLALRLPAPWRRNRPRPPPQARSVPA